MTEQEAIKELHGIRPRGGIIPQKRAESIDMAINALEKQIPQQPIVRGLGQKYCPTCKYGGANDLYCSKCGQKLRD